MATVDSSAMEVISMSDTSDSTLILASCDLQVGDMIEIGQHSNCRLICSESYLCV